MLKGQQAWDIADKYRPRIFQQIQSPLGLDFITAIQIGDEIQIKQNILELSLKPVLYFVSNEDEAYEYVTWMIYHPFDWSDKDLPNFLGLKEWYDEKDSHRHDTEAVGIRVSKQTGVMDVVTVAHHAHYFGWDTELNIYCEAQSHALFPLEDIKNKEGMCFLYETTSYEINNIAEWKEEQLKSVVQSFKNRPRPVSWINDYFDLGMKLTTARGMYRNQGLQHLPGDIFLDLGKLFKIGKKLNR